MQENVQEKTMDRRNILKWALGLGSVLGLAPLSKTVAQVCAGPTPRQPEGPFYPVQDQADQDTDLTTVRGRTATAVGEVIWVEGIVSDENCRPLAGVLVEIWQACASGKYNHPGDRDNPAPLDPNFQYWGRALTDQEGKYAFKTILPGAYPAGEGWIRPPHIHFKAHKRGFLELTTQMYFKGERYNDADLILGRLAQAEREKVVVELKQQRAHFPLTLIRA